MWARGDCHPLLVTHILKNLNGVRECGRRVGHDVWHGERQMEVDVNNKSRNS